MKLRFPQSFGPWLALVVLALVAVPGLLFFTRLRIARDTRQRIGVIEEMGGHVGFSCHFGQFSNEEWSYGDGNPYPTGHPELRRESGWPKWARDRMGYEFFHDVCYVRIMGNDRARHDPVESERFWNTIAAFPRIGGLVLDYDSKKSPEAMRRFNGTTMRNLHYYQCAVSPEELDVIATWNGLQKIDMILTSIDDEGFARLGTLEDVRQVNLAGSRVTDHCCDTLARWPKLRVLSLGNLPITDVGVQRLVVLERLEDLDLDETRLSDEGLLALARLPALQRLDAAKTDVTAEGIREFRQRRGSAGTVDLTIEPEKLRAAARLDGE